MLLLFSTPKPWAPGKLIVYAGSVVRRRRPSIHNFKRPLL